MRFVIADDSSIPRDILRSILIGAGHEVVGVAPDGEAAVALCGRLHPDVVILDVSMPRLSGDQAARKILSANTARYVVIASSMSMAAIFKPLQELGAHTLAKPYRKEQLLAALESIINGSP